MENGRQMECGPTLPSSSSIISYSAQTQAQESRNQMNMSMNMNTGHYVLPHDSQESRLMCLQSPPNVSNTLNFGSCKSLHPEIGTSFLSLLSAPPPLLQHDFQQQSNLKLFSSSHYPASSDLCQADIIPNWPLHNSGYSSPRPNFDVHPVDPSWPTMSVNKYNSRGQSEKFDSQRVHITHAGPRNENCSSNSMQKGEYSAPSSTVNSEISYGLNSNAMLEASLQPPSPASKKQASVLSGCPSVFCMGACGDLLLSNTGLFGILCSCHGLHMSVSNFCEHSGLSDVNPGYAVRMDSGESIAQWRKLYLQKFGHGDKRMVIFL